MNKEEKEEMIDKICRKEDGIQKVKEWLVSLFIFAAIVVVIVCYRALSAPANDNGKTAVMTIIITLSIFAGLIIAGYFYNKVLSKKLNKLWEQKKSLSLLLVCFIFLFSSCHPSKTLEGVDALRYIEDNEKFISAEVLRHFDPSNTKLFFVKKFNSPAFYSYNGAFNGISYDWKIFRGTEFGDSIYFIEDRRLYSPEFIAWVGDSVINLECRFAKANVSEDPRTTAWWIGRLGLSDDTIKICSFLEEITCGAERVEIEKWTEELNLLISTMPGVSDYQKIKRYTLLATPGSNELPECEYAADEVGWGYFAELLAKSRSEETARLKIKVPVRASK